MSVGQIVNSKWFYIFCLVIILGVSLIFRLINISQENFSLDEAFSVHNAQHNLGDITRIIANENYPPLYQYLLHFWLNISGVSEGSARSLSVIIGLLSIVIMYLLGKEIFGRKVGLWAAFLTGISAFHIEFSQEARMYIFLFLLSASTTLFLWKALQSGKKKYLFWYSLFSILNLYTHFFAIVFLACQFLFAVYYFIIKRSPYILRRNYLISLLMIVIVFAPWLPNLINRFIFFQKGFWALETPLTIPDIISHLPHYFFLNYSYGENVTFFAVIPFLYYLIPITLLIFAFNYRKREERRELYNKLLFLFISYLLPIAISYAVHIYSPRYLIIILVPLYLIMAKGLEGLRKPYLKEAVIILILIMMVPAWAEVLRVHFDWPRVAQYITRQEKDKDAIILYSPMHEYLFGYYYQGATPVKAYFPLAQHNKRDDETERLKYSGFVIIDERTVDAEIAYLTYGYDRVWLVAFQQRILDENNLVRDWLNKDYQFESYADFPYRFVNEQVKVFLYSKKQQ